MQRSISWHTTLARVSSFANAALLSRRSRRLNFLISRKMFGNIEDFSGAYIASYVIIRINCVKPMELRFKYMYGLNHYNLGLNK